MYFGDIGLRNIIAGGERNSDIEKIIENAVKANDRRYVQVAYIVADEKTEAREFGRLKNINDNYPKYVISMTPLVKRRDHEGITHLGLREFPRNGFSN